MKKWQQKIRNFKDQLNDYFSDKYAIKNDHTNRIMSRYNRWINKLTRKLWYD